MRPVLVDLDRLRQLGPRELVVRSLEAFGTCCLDRETYPDAGSLPVALRVVWRTWAAMEALVAGSSGAVGRDWARGLADVRPLGSEFEPLSALMRARWAAAAFPLDGHRAHGPASALALMPAIRIPCLRRRMLSSKRVAGYRVGVGECAGRQVFLVSSSEGAGIAGDSWRLAAALARRALDSADTRHVGSLASDWIVSGHVDGDRVLPVELGNKLQLATRRGWMLPSAARLLLPAGFQGPGGLRLVSTVDEAWRVIAGEGTIHGGREPWPGRIGSLHTFVSGAWQPVVAACLMARVDRVRVWRTGDRAFRALARAIRTVLGTLSPETVVTLMDISSSSLHKAEADLRPVLEEDLRQGEVFFNVTQGNRLMSFAVQTFARVHPGLRMIYRDLDARPFDFVQIRYQSAQPATVVLKGRPMCAGVRYDVLFSRAPARRPPSAEEIVGLLKNGPKAVSDAASRVG